MQKLILFGEANNLNKKALFFVYIFIVFIFSFFIFVSKIEAQACVDVTETATCNPGTATVGGVGYFSTGPSGVQVKCDLYTSGETAQDRTCNPCNNPVCGPYGSCYSNESYVTAAPQDCNNNMTCGNGSKDPYECCDGGAGCSLNCSCIVSPNNEISTFCGDYICGSGENAGNCPQDCSVACVLSSVTPEGPQNIVVHQGDTNFIGAEFGYTAGPVNYDFLGCPPNATCSGTSGTVDVGQFDPQETRFFIISPSAATPPGNYPILGRFYDSDNFTCQYTIRYNVRVLASRKVVCDGSWNEMPGSYGVVNEFNVSGFGATLGNFVNAKTVDFAYKASRDFYRQKCSYGILGFSDTCTWKIG